ncbi:MAG: hypothetical protein ACKOEM_17935, partial [Planctomycetia bacterium]
ETADGMQHRTQSEEVIARAPDHIRAAINGTRIRRGLAPVLSIRDYQRLDQERRLAEAAAVESEKRRGSGVWVNGPRGSLVPWTPKTKIATRAPVNPATSRGPLVDRVLLVAAYGDATARAVRSHLPETVAFNAFGSATDLNRDKRWSLRSGHGGPVLAYAGDRLRAHDSSAGLIVEWIPDMTLSWNRETVRAIEEGRTACSVGMVIGETRLTRLPHLVNMVTRARLTHVAILDGDHLPAYAGARAKVFRSSWRDDRDELRKQIESTIERARWFARQSRGY